MPAAKGSARSPLGPKTGSKDGDDKNGEYKEVFNKKDGERRIQG